MSAVASELEGASVLDLFAGSGALGIEALSRGAVHAIFVESAPRATEVLRGNLKDLDVPPDAYRVVREDVFRFLQREPVTRADIAFADPPYGSGAAERLIELFGTKPFADLLCVEHRRDLALHGSPIWQRSYGDSCLTFLTPPDDAE